MLIGAYPFEDPADPKNFRKTIQRILAVQWGIPQWAKISHECQDILARIFVADPRHRITMAQIRATPWFQRNLAAELAGPPGSEADAASDATLQSVDEINRLLMEARTVGAPALQQPSWVDDEMPSEETPYQED